MPKRKQARTPYLVEQQLKSEIKWIKETFKYRQPELINERLAIWRNSEDSLKRDVARNFHI